MALKETIKDLNHLLVQLTKDLCKAERGNKAASQRVRTGTIKLAKRAKTYRKESIAAEKQKRKKRPAHKKSKRKSRR